MWELRQQLYWQKILIHSKMSSFISVNGDITPLVLGCTDTTQSPVAATQQWTYTEPPVEVWPESSQLDLESEIKLEYHPPPAPPLPPSPASPTPKASKGKKRAASLAPRCCLPTPSSSAPPSAQQETPSLQANNADVELAALQCFGAGLAIGLIMFYFLRVPSPEA